MNLHEQARAEAERLYPNVPRTESWSNLRAQNAYADGFLAGHEAATRTRVVTTVTELDALAVGSVVLNTRGDAWQKRGTNGRWYVVGLPGGQKEVPYLPVRVLYDPEEGR